MADLITNANPKALVILLFMISFNCAAQKGIALDSIKIYPSTMDSLGRHPLTTGIVYLPNYAIDFDKVLESVVQKTDFDLQKELADLKHQIDVLRKEVQEITRNKRKLK